MSHSPIVPNAILPNDLSQGTNSGCTDGCTPDPENSISDPNLIRLIELWPSLPAIERFAVLEFVEKQVASNCVLATKVQDESHKFQSV